MRALPKCLVTAVAIFVMTTLGRVGDGRDGEREPVDLDALGYVSHSAGARVLATLASGSADVEGRALTHMEGHLLAARTSTGNIAIIDTDSQRRVLTLTAPRPVSSTRLASSRSGLVAAVCGDTVVVWNAGSGAIVGRWRAPGGRSETLALSPDGKYVAVGGTSGVAAFSSDAKRLLSIDTGRTGHVAFTSAGTLLCGSDHVVEYDVSTGKKVRTFELTGIGCTSLAASAGGDTICACDGAVARAWDRSSGQVLWEQISLVGLDLLAVSNDGLVWAACRTGTSNGVLVKDRGRTPEALLPETDEPPRAPILGLAISDDGSRTAVASASELAVHEPGGKLRVVGRYALGRLPERVVESAWQPGRTELLLVGSEGQVFVWRPGAGPATRLRETAIVAAPLAVGTSDAGAFVVGRFSGVWIPSSQQPASQVATVSYGPAVSGGAHNALVCADGSTAILIDRLGTIAALRRTSGEFTTEILHTPPDAASAPAYVAASRTGDRIVFATESGRVVALRRGHDGTEVVRSTIAESAVLAVAVSPDGEFLGYATRTRLVIQSFAQGKDAPRVAEAGERITSAEFAPSGDRLAYGTAAGTIGVLERSGPDGLQPLVEPSDKSRVVAVHWNRDGTQICAVQLSGQLSVISASR